MDLSRQQEQAIAAVEHWFKHDSKTQQVYKLMGFAGTGKTTLAKYFAQSIEGEVVFAAYTGKAAYVLRQKGCAATTIHSQIYRPRDKSKRHFVELQEQLTELETQYETEPTEPLLHQITQLKKSVQKENSNLHQPMFELWINSPIKFASLIIIDEVSMVDERMAVDLLSFGVPILVIGDSEQLPPPFGQGFFTSGNPDFMLTDIHRQAKDNPIIHLATRVREKKSLQVGSYGDSRVINKADVQIESWMEADQIIVGKNATRHASNRRMRELLNYNINDPRCLPQLHDRLVCLRNNSELGLLNGGLWMVTEALEENFIPEAHPKFMINIQGDELGSEDISLWHVLIHTYPFQGKDKKNIPPWEIKEAEEFDFGYTLTCHKAQGSQWDYVMVYDESFVFKQNRHKWLYTAITRAARHVDVVKI